MPRIHPIAAALGVELPRKRGNALPRLPAPGKLLLDINEVAGALGVGRRTAYVLRERPDFPKPVTLASRIVRYKAADVQTYVERLTVDAAPAVEPERLRAGKRAKLASGGGLSGERKGRAAAKARRSMSSAEGLSVEPEKAVG